MDPKAIDFEPNLRRTMWLSDLRQDIRVTRKHLMRSFGFTAVTVLTIALGVGAATTVFSVMNALLIRPLPVTNPEQLYAVQERRENNVTTSNGYTAIPYERYKAYEAATQRTFGGLVAQRYDNFALRSGETTVAVSGTRTSGNYFTVLALSPAAGRFFTDTKEPAIVMSHQLWQQRFSGNREIVGSTIYLDSRPYTVAGIAPPGFTGTLVGFGTDVWVPLHANLRADENHDPKVFPFGRLRDGVDATAGAAALDAAAKAIPPEAPHVKVHGARLEPLTGMSEEWRGPANRFLQMILGTAVLVMLIAAANIAGLMLARAVARRREFAVRIAMGAGRGRLIRLLLTESLILFVLGAIGGVVLANSITALMERIHLPIGAGITLEFSPDWRVFAFSLAAAGITGILFGLAPALQLSRPDLVPALKAGLGSTDVENVRGRNIFVAAQVAAAVVLLVMAGLFVRALQRGLSVDPGFQPDGVVVATTDLGPHNYTEERGRVFYAQLMEKVRALPGVEGAGLASIILLGGSAQGNDVHAVDRSASGQQSVAAYHNWVDAGYFETMRVPIIAGSAFGDDGASANGAVINQKLASMMWPGENPIGKHLREGDRTFEVVGLAQDGRYLSMGEETRPFMFQSAAGEYNPRLTLHVRTREDPMVALNQIREQVRQLDPNIALERAGPLPPIVGLSLLPQRVGATLIGVFGLLGLLLAAIGVYGVLAFQVAQRSREIGIRFALGASVRGVLTLVLGQGARLAIAGGIVGLVIALGATRFLRSFIFGVSPLDPLTFVAVPVILLLVALVASYLPARKAMKVSPMQALRAE